MKRFIQGFVAALCIAAMLGMVLRASSLAFWAVAIIVAVVLGSLRARGSAGTTGGLVAGAFLCDSCKYNHPNTCSLPDRPNATRCADYKRRGT